MPRVLRVNEGRDSIGEDVARPRHPWRFEEVERFADKLEIELESEYGSTWKIGRTRRDATHHYCAPTEPGANGSEYDHFTDTLPSPSDPYKVVSDNRDSEGAGSSLTGLNESTGVGSHECETQSHGGAIYSSIKPAIHISDAEEITQQHGLQELSPPHNDSMHVLTGLSTKSIAKGVVNSLELFMHKLYHGYRTFPEPLDELNNTDEPWHLESGRSPRPRGSNKRSRSPVSSFSPSVAGPTNGHGVMAMTTSPATIDSNRGSNNEGAQLRPHPTKRMCYYLIATLIIGLTMSFAVALWWTREIGDTATGFKVGSYVVAVCGTALAAAGYFHAPRCRCWKSVM
ncbi:hypothetical protein GGR57DRAFT_497257 [Xylariaceae sp. FL1272]|nr:hypothetical protein GGR57DRAFT_497257 [Xylariaceae sp. FL1272]